MTRHNLTTAGREISDAANAAAQAEYNGRTCEDCGGRGCIECDYDGWTLPPDEDEEEAE